MDAFLPGIGNWKNVWLCATSGTSIFTRRATGAGEGREPYLPGAFLERLSPPIESAPCRGADRRLYARAYAQPGAMRAGFEYFRQFRADAEDFARMGSTRLPCRWSFCRARRPAELPHRAGQTRRVGRPRPGVRGAGHWLMEEAPDTVIPP